MDNELEQLLTVAQVAKALRVDNSTVRRWVRHGDLDAITLPGREKRALRIRISALDKILKGTHENREEVTV